ncbi:hypothetical protein SprV_0301364300 [Sparganum proliferum]
MVDGRSPIVLTELNRSVVPSVSCQSNGSSSLMTRRLMADSVWELPQLQVEFKAAPAAPAAVVDDDGDDDDDGGGGGGGGGGGVDDDADEDDDGDYDYDDAAEEEEEEEEADR